MAFNPLHTLRKHQKGLMAALVLICMVTFILSSGSQFGGDFFDWARYQVTGRSSIPQVATLHGQRVDIQDLQRLRHQREVADRYMRNALAMASSYIQEQISRLDEEAKKKGPDANTARQQESLRATWMALLQRIPPNNQFYFGGTPSAEDLLDFMLWRKQADRLGIQLNQADVRKERNAEIGVELPEQHLVAVERMTDMDRSQRLTSEVLVSALADEFRVRMAKEAILGPDAPAPPLTLAGANIRPAPPSARAWWSSASWPLSRLGSTPSWNGATR